ncbi:hypothetical protein LINPERPRIM_LOCUS14789 [Linum perenne]
MFPVDYLSQRIWDCKCYGL